MTHQPTLFNPSEADERPLPLIVAARWNFPLAHHQTETGLLYAVQDWLRGLSGEEDTRRLWTDFKRTKAGKQMSDSIVPLPYKASDGKTYKRDHTSDKGLYLIAQYLRVKHDRPVLDEIRRFLAAAGAFVDEARRDPDVLLEGVTNPDKLIDAVIEYYRKRGKDDQWIQARIEGKINRNQFTAALAEFVRDMLKPHYGTATDDVYRGLWGRSAARLREELQLPGGANLRDHQPMLALQYQGIVEGVCAQKIGTRQELDWTEAREIIQMVAAMIGRQAKEVSQFLQTDLATGKPLLPGAQGWAQPSESGA
jgi:hypothetical protein